MDRTNEQGYWIHAKRMGDDVGEAFGDWIEGLGEWQWFVTRTLGRPVDMGFTKPGKRTALLCLHELLERTESDRFVAVFEMQEERGVPHVHALLAGCRSVDGGLEQERDFHKWGIARWKKYTKNAGAPAYLGKYLGKDIIELFIGDRRPTSIRDLEAMRV